MIQVRFRLSSMAVSLIRRRDLPEDIVELAALHVDLLDGDCGLTDGLRDLGSDRHAALRQRPKLQMPVDLADCLDSRNRGEALQRLSDQIGIGRRDADRNGAVIWRALA